MSSAARETPDKYAQYIYVDKPYIIRFCDWLLTKQYWFDVQWSDKGGRYQIRFAITIDLREELPASLRGKFSQTI